MQIDPEEFRRYYDSLSNEALLALDREELVDIAKQCYDEELARRGLLRETDANEGDVQGTELVPVAAFLFPDEAKLARGLLQSSTILCYLENEHTLSAMWTWSQALGGLQLKVPASLAEQAQEILDSTVTDNDLAAESGALADSTDKTQPVSIVGTGGPDAYGCGSR